MEKTTLNQIIKIAVLLLLVTLVAACGKKNSETQQDTNLVPESAELYEEGDPGLAAADSIAAGTGSHTSSQPSGADSIGLKNFSYTWTDSKEIPPVIIIVDDFGYAGGELLQGFADLPPEVAFAVLPDLPFTQKSAQLAQHTGHDVLIHAPMEAKLAKIKPGERYLKTGQDRETVANMLNAFHEQMPMAIAVNNHMGSTATSDKDLMRMVLDHLDKRGLFFVDSVTIKETVGYNLANTLGYRSVRRNLFLDVPDNTDATIAARISDLGRFRGRKEPVILITHCHNKAKLTALNKFIDQIKAMGVRLTSLSAYYGRAYAMTDTQTELVPNP